MIQPAINLVDQVAQRNHDVQMADFIESTFLAEQVKKQSISFYCIFVYSQSSKVIEILYFLIDSLNFCVNLGSGWKHKKDLGICRSAEKNWQRTRFVLWLYHIVLMNKLNQPLCIYTYKLKCWTMSVASWTYVYCRSLALWSDASSWCRSCCMKWDRGVLCWIW